LNYTSNTFLLIMTTPHPPHFPPHHPIHSLIATQTLVSPHTELLSSLSRIVKSCPPSPAPKYGWALSGLYKGPTSTAYLFLQLGKLYPGMEVRGKELGEWGGMYLDAAEGSDVGGKRWKKGKGMQEPSPGNCGICNEVLAHAAVTAAANRNGKDAEKLCNYSSLVLSTEESTKEISYEWLYGLSGYLYLLRLALSGFQPSDAVYATLRHTIDKIVHRVATAQLPWIWHNTQFLGPCHGDLGILVQLCKSSPTIAPKFSDLLKKTLTYQLPTGNFPITPLRPEEDRYVQWCHGSPGAAVSLTSLRHFFPDLESEIDEALEKARSNVWKKGLLVKEPCLCHGVAGNALSFEIGDERFGHFVDGMSEKALGEVWGISQDGGVGGKSRMEGVKDEDKCDDNAASLYCGEAGRAWVWAVRHVGGNWEERWGKGGVGRFIGFDDV
jgi:hypothetical protein